MWYFDADAGLCREFFWGGCGGNPDQRFDAEAACLAACAPPPAANATGNATGDGAPLGPAVRRTVSGKECIDDSPVLGGCVDIAGVPKCRVAGGEYEECAAPVAGNATLDAALGEALPAAEPGPAAASAAEEHGHTHRGVPHEHQHAHPGAPPHAHEHIDAGHKHGDEGAEWAAASPAEEHGHTHDDVPHDHDHEHVDGTVHQHAHDDAGHTHALPDHPEDAAAATPRPEDLPDEGSEWEEPTEPTQVQEEPAPNCACTCCLPGQCDEPKQYRTYVEDRKDCSVEMCGNRFYGCPNAGSHNDDAVVTAAFGAAPAAEAQVQEEPVPESRAQAPAAPAPPVNCVCSCCLPDSCANGLRTYETFVNEPADCNPETCGDRFYGCPDATGSHNDRAEAFASFVDCSCGCNDERGGAVYAEPKRFQSLGPKRCNPDRCDKEFPGFCARAGYMTTAAFTGVEEAEADCDCTCCPAGDTCSSEPYGIAAGRGSLCTKQACSERLARCDIRFDVITARYRGVETVELPGGLSPAAAGGIAAAVIVVAAAIIGAALTYSYVAIKRRRGYAWVLHEHEENTSHMVKTDLGDDGPPSEESSPVAQP